MMPGGARCTAYHASGTHIVRNVSAAERGERHVCANPSFSISSRSPSPQDACQCKQPQAASRERTCSPEFGHRRIIDHSAKHVNAYRNESHQQATNIGVASSRSSWSVGCPSASKQMGFVCEQPPSVTCQTQVHTAGSPRPGMPGTLTNPAVSPRQLSVSQAVKPTCAKHDTSFHGALQQEFDMALDMLKHEQSRAITNLEANFSHKLDALEQNLKSQIKLLESRLRALETDTQKCAESATKEQNKLASIEERLAELHEFVEQNETVAKMRADFEHRLCDLEVQAHRTLSNVTLLPEPEGGKFENVNNTIAVKSDSVAGRFATMPHSINEQKSDDYLTATFIYRLHAVENNVDLVASILSKMEDRMKNRPQTPSDNVDLATPLRDMGGLQEQAREDNITQAGRIHPDALSRSLQLRQQLTDSTCFPISE